MLIITKKSILFVFFTLIFSPSYGLDDKNYEILNGNKVGSKLFSQNVCKEYQDLHGELFVYYNDNNLILKNRYFKDFVFVYILTYIFLFIIILHNYRRNT